jgi:hypothetical protein
MDATKRIPFRFLKQPVFRSMIRFRSLTLFFIADRDPTPENIVFLTIHLPFNHPGSFISPFGKTKLITRGISQQMLCIPPDLLWENA